MKTERIGFLIGIFLTAVVTIFTFLYLDYRTSKELGTKRKKIYDSVESIELRYNDLKFKFREQEFSHAPVALIAIDDDSLREIGRWPWSREIIGQMTDKAISLGAKSVSFDAIFSEPERAGEKSDQYFGQVIAKNADKVILGTFSEDMTPYLPHQDYCIAEAFLKTGGSDIVKLNPTFIVEDLTTSELDDLKWGDLFTPLFNEVQASKEASILKGFNKKSLSELTKYQKNFIESEKTKSLYAYCHDWLTDEDPFLSGDGKKDVIKHYEAIIRQHPKFSDSQFDDFYKKIKKSALSHPIPQYAEWTGNIADLQTQSTYTASFVAKLDSDGYVRRYPLFFRSGNKLGSSFIPSLALQSYLIHHNYRADVKIDRDINAKDRIITQFTIVDPSTNPETKIIDVPVDPAGQVLVNYYGPNNSLPFIPAKEFFNDNETMQIHRSRHDAKVNSYRYEPEVVNKKEFLKDRSLIVGATAYGLYDLRNTPTSANYPGPEIHLTMLANLIEKNFLTEWTKESKYLPIIMIIIGLLLAYAFSHLSPILSLGVAGVALGFGFVIDVWIFLKYQTKTSGLFVGFLVATVYGSITIYRFFTEEQKKRQLRSTFSKYVSPAIVDELLKEPDNLNLGGRRQRMSAFFSDIRGFTTIAEGLTPENLVKLLNRYLSPMTEIVFENKGTLDKYMGDAIMAFFGAPIPYPDHAAEACRCALKSVEKLKVLQLELEAEGLPKIDIGIGINTGDMNVGNMGSNIVQSYTVMGDAVNLASRLEGINKEYGTKIIISEFTYQDVKEQFVAREIDRVKVKGKTEPVRIYELLKEGAPSAEESHWLATFAGAYMTYLKQDFGKAKELFGETLKISPNDNVANLYIERCDEYLAEPPPKDWDGVFVLKTK